MPSRHQASTPTASSVTRITILDGLANAGSHTHLLRQALRDALESPEFEVRHMHLESARLSPCLGCFQCWVRTPGVCIRDTDGRDVARNAIQCDVLMLVTPISFGCYSAALKRGLDGLLPNLSPFFTTVEGQTHHRPRYPAYPALLAIGVVPPEHPAKHEHERIFNSLVDRNRINLNAPHARTLIVESGTETAELTDRVRHGVAMLRKQREAFAAEAPDGMAACTDMSVSATLRCSAPPTSAVLLIGSPRRASTSLALANVLAASLSDAGVHVEEPVHVHRALRHPEERERLFARLATAHLVVLTSPVYVDAFPSGVLELIEQLPANVRGQRAFAVILNCGFPEPEHGAVALDIARAIARDMSWRWLGGVTVGGGEAIKGRALSEVGSMVRHVAQGLESVGKSLARGEPLPEEVRAAFSRPLMPPWMYRLAGNFGWRSQAREIGTTTPLDARPWEADER